MKKHVKKLVAICLLSILTGMFASTYSGPPTGGTTPSGLEFGDLSYKN